MTKTAGYNKQNFNYKIYIHRVEQNSFHKVKHLLTLLGVRVYVYILYWDNYFAFVL